MTGCSVKIGRYPCSATPVEQRRSVPSHARTAAQAPQTTTTLRPPPAETAYPEPLRPPPEQLPVMEIARLGRLVPRGPPQTATATRTPSPPKPHTQCSFSENSYRFCAVVEFCDVSVDAQLAGSTAMAAHERHAHFAQQVPQREGRGPRAVRTALRDKSPSADQLGALPVKNPTQRQSAHSSGQHVRLIQGVRPPLQQRWRPRRSRLNLHCQQFLRCHRSGQAVRPLAKSSSKRGPTADPLGVGSTLCMTRALLQRQSAVRKTAGSYSSQPAFRSMV